MNKKELDKKIAELVNKLPPLPSNAERLLIAASKKEAGKKEAMELIRQDSSLCAEILHFANSDCIIRKSRIDTLDEAIEKAGLDMLISLVGVGWAASSIEKSYSKLINLEKYFQHEREISICCQILAELGSLEEHYCKMAFAGGLMHDIGRLVIMIAKNKPFAPMLGIMPDDMDALIKDESEAIGMNHCEIGMEICRKWNFSPIFQEGILRHHTPLIDHDFSYPGAYIFVAHFVSMSDLTGEMLCQMLPGEILNKLHISAEKFNHAKEIYHSGKY